YNQKTNPALLDGKLRITLELLAPNYRPTQVTSQLENFWKSGYFEIKKELKARYPKHAWPDDPANFIMPERPPRK
ncbi:MAG: ATP-dependent helicase C-terminal domain-containing protein, partial [Pseudobdellovibrio sp.]